MMLSAVAIALASVLIVLLLNKNIDLLRVRGRCRNGQVKFSLSRLQLAFWMYILLCTIVYVYLCDKQSFQVDTKFIFNKSLWWILVISVVTYLSSIIIEFIDNKTTTSTSNRLSRCSQGLFKDLFYVHDKISFTRLQFTVVSLICMTVFMTKVLLYDTVDLPELLRQLLLISSGLYQIKKIVKTKSKSH